MAEAAITPDEIQAQIVMIKGKRTKRHRPPSPSYSAAEYCSSSSVCDDQEEAEDQDMANCLILLAQGREKSATESPSSLYVYQCKTCDRCFPSFQALGGHRASHKKPKNNLNFINSLEEQQQQRQHHNNSTANVRLSLELSSSGCRPPSKVHECAICGAEFSSGQALGGHMRRHRALTTAAAATATTPVLMMKKERRVLELDLNLPAPEVAVPFGGLPLLIQN